MSSQKLMGIAMSAAIALAAIFVYNRFSGSSVAELGKPGPATK